MARNGSGTYSLYTPGNPVVTGTTISSTAFNNTMNDLATALTLSIASDGQTPITANIPMASHKITGLAAGTTAGDALMYGQSGAMVASLTVTTTLTGPTGVITSGTYTPTLTNVNNVNAGASAATTCYYTRIGSVVTVSGGMDVRASATSDVQVGISLPIASALATWDQLAGTVQVAPTGTIASSQTGYGISADATNDRATASFGAVGTTAQAISYVFTFTYLVI